MTRDSITAEISSRVAENAVCWCDGRKKRSSLFIKTRAIEAQSYRNLKRSVLTVSHPAVETLVLTSVHVHLARGDQVYARNFRAQSYIAPSRFLLCFRNERKQVLMLPAPVQILQIRCKRHGSPGHPYVISLPASSIRYLRQVKLAPVALPVAVAEVSRPGLINRRDHNILAHAIVHRRIDVRILQIPGAVIAVDAVAHHQHRMPRIAFRPALGQIAQREVWAGIRARDSLRKSESLGCRRVIRTGILSNLGRAVPHIGYAHQCGCWQSINELADVIQLRAQIRARAVVEQDEHFLRGVISLRRHPIHHLVPVLPLIHHHFILLNYRNIVAVLRFRRYREMHSRSRFRSRLAVSQSSSPKGTRQYCRRKYLMPLHHASSTVRSLEPTSSFGSHNAHVLTD